METNDIIHEIENLRKRAKEGEFYKKKFDDLKEEVQNVMTKLNEIVLAKTPIVRLSENKSLTKNVLLLIDEVYQKMKYNNFEVSAEIIEKELQSKNLCKASAYIYAVIGKIKSMPGIDVKFPQGNKRVYFYNQYKDNTLNTEDNKILFNKLSLKV